MSTREFAKTLGVWWPVALVDLHVPQEAARGRFGPYPANGRINVHNMNLMRHSTNHETSVVQGQSIERGRTSHLVQAGINGRKASAKGVPTPLCGVLEGAANVHPNY